MQESLRFHPNMKQVGFQNNGFSPISAEVPPQPLPQLLCSTGSSDPYCLLQVFALMIRAEKKQLYKTIRGNPVKSLYLALNRLGPAGVRLLVDAIKFQQRSAGPAYRDGDGLEILYLDSNVIGDFGAEAIAELIAPNPQGFVEGSLLKLVSLQSNRITDKGAQALYDALQNNGNILSLNWGRNFMNSPSLMEAIRLRLEKNCCISLYYSVRKLRIDAGVSVYSATVEAQEIKDYYEARTQCCERITWERCA